MVGCDWTVEGNATELAGQTLTVRRAADGLTFADLKIPLLGQHQWVNATTAVAMLTELGAQGVTIPEAALRRGLAAARWPGRFELLQRRPVVVVDSAHNADSAQKLRAALATWFPRPPRKRLALVFGASSDKDISGMLEAFLTPDPASGYRPVDKVIVTQSGHPRSTVPAALADQVRHLSPIVPISVHDTVGSALTEALAWANEDDLICVTGSIFVVAQARRAWANRHPDAFPADDWVFQDETAGEPVSDDENKSEVGG
jgi:dihydrofolate synthase/folylpolyglutamate synthase